MYWLFYIIILCVLYYFYDHIGLALWAKDVKGKIILITGGAHGIGKGTAKELAKLGANVVLWDINKTNLDRAVEEIKSAGGEAWGFVCDVSKPENVSAVAKEVKSSVGAVDILMNNAGIVIGKELLDTSDEETMRVINVNLMSQFWTVKAFLPDMIARNNGHIVNIASVMGHFATYKLVDYSVSKFGVVGLSDGIRTELRQKGVTGVKVTYINPNAINTGMFAGISFMKSLQGLLMLEEPWVVQEIVKNSLLVYDISCLFSCLISLRKMRWRQQKEWIRLLATKENKLIVACHILRTKTDTNLDALNLLNSK